MIVCSEYGFNHRSDHEMCKHYRFLQTNMHVVMHTCSELFCSSVFVAYVVIVRSKAFITRSRNRNPHFQSILWSLQFLHRLLKIHDVHDVMQFQCILLTNIRHYWPLSSMTDQQQKPVQLPLCNAKHEHCYHSPQQ